MKSRSLILPLFFPRCSTTPSVLKPSCYPQSKRRREAEDWGERCRTTLNRPHHRSILQLNWFLEMHLISKALRLIFGTQCSTAFHNGHQASTGWLRVSASDSGGTNVYPIRHFQGTAGCRPTANPQYKIVFIKTIKWDHTVHNCLSYPANEVAGSAKNTGEGAGGGS